MTKKKRGKRVYVFLTWEAITPEKEINPSEIFFLAEGTVVKKVADIYTIRIDSIFVDFFPNVNKGRSLFPIGEEYDFHSLWVERGKEAYDKYFNPSFRGVNKFERKVQK